MEWKSSGSRVTFSTRHFNFIFSNDILRLFSIFNPGNNTRLHGFGFCTVVRKVYSVVVRPRYYHSAHQIQYHWFHLPRLSVWPDRITLSTGSAIFRWTGRRHYWPSRFWELWSCRFRPTTSSLSDPEIKKKTTLT